MPSETELHFREVESQLDDALQRDRATITAEGIEVFDESQRAYQQNNLYLSWSLRFEMRRSNGSETTKVWGTISVAEDQPTVAKLWRRTEIFQIGARPRWEKTSESETSLRSLIRDGLAATVVREIAQGKLAVEGSRPELP